MTCSLCGDTGAIAEDNSVAPKGYAAVTACPECRLFQNHLSAARAIGNDVKLLCAQGQTLAICLPRPSPKGETSATG